MARRIVALFTLLAFLIFSGSCMVYRVQQKSFASVARKGPRVKILALQTKAREYLEFGESRPARISNGVVLGEVLKTVEFRREDIAEWTAFSSNLPHLVRTKDGRSYNVLAARFEGDQLVCQAYMPVSIPLADVDLAWIKTANTGASIGQTIGAVLAVGLLIALLAVDEDAGDEFFDSLFEDSGGEAPPPPVYKDFWESYFIDAELHGAAPGQGFTITEWTAVEDSPAPDGTTKLQLRDELMEAKSIDELKIFLVDHAPGTTVMTDLKGEMHTVREPVKPRKAVDRHGHDILPLVAGRDNLLWTSPEEERNPTKKEDLRDELVFEFPKPQGVKYAKLVVNATNTMWASHFAGMFLSVPGRSIFAQPPTPGEPDLAGGRARDWYRDEEFYKLRVWVETKNGWMPRQAIYGGGPFVPRDQIGFCDIHDVSGPTLKIKLMPPANFWMIDRLVVDYCPDVTIHQAEAAVLGAAAPGLDGREILSAIQTTDGRYLVLSNPGDTVEIAFVNPPPPPGLDRSVMLRTVSRYEIRPSLGAGVPAAIAERVIREPGFAARYALEEYMKWEALLRAKLGDSKHGSDASRLAHDR
jgi:hypothetical protein